MSNKEVVVDFKMVESTIRDILGRDITLNKAENRSSLPTNGEDGQVYYLLDEDVIVGWDSASSSWRRPTKWLDPVANYGSLTITYPYAKHGDACMVLSEYAIYGYDSSVPVWRTSSAFPKGFSFGCRPEWTHNDYIHIEPGTISIYDRLYSKNESDIVDFINDLESPYIRQPNTFYYVYLIPDPQDDSTFKAIFSILPPTRDYYGNTIDPSSPTQKYHPTKEARFVGSILTDSIGNIVNFKVSGNYTSYIKVGYNYILLGGGAQVKTGVNVRSKIPMTSNLGKFLFQMDTFNKQLYLGDDTIEDFSSWGGSGYYDGNISNNSIFYRVSGATMNIGVKGYYEDI